MHPQAPKIPLSFIQDKNIEENLNSIANILRNAKKPLIISGSNAYNPKLIEASLNIFKSLKLLKKNPGILLLAQQSNSIGVSMLSKNPVENILHNVISGKKKVAIILENDIYRNAPKSLVNNFFKHARLVICLDH